MLSEPESYLQKNSDKLPQLINLQLLLSTCYTGRHLHSGFYLAKTVKWQNSCKTLSVKDNSEQINLREKDCWRSLTPD
jgi:hypothetical protein